MRMVTGKGWWPFFKATMSHLHPEMLVRYADDSPIEPLMGYLLSAIGIVVLVPLMLPFALFTAFWKMVVLAPRRYKNYVVNGVK